MMINILIVALGGALGSVARYALGAMFDRSNIILYINIMGSFILGLIMAYLAHHLEERNETLKLLLGIGFCGGFTTFSTFSMEAWEMIISGKTASAIIYIICSVVFSILSFGLGFYLAKTL